ncbi:hypothetical protein [Peptoniphilus lacrimalis]|uniref:Uncharacterized protein n=1 Tax=Peptoniphilus lacrimalis TaxID=33031 RepID=A0A379C7R8_9FIRM|nr:hypothetical protein [Peptoniphilus lacrimalis]MDK7722525.1 hypothetical protein [Peptoniphilus lacrimalis]MDK7732086.1 hypothetical protein [Peptoniphilus lacrimalis]SUB57745.1 Uncharacterised protein [Peptoniphilus lacrimalis]
MEKEREEIKDAIEKIKKSLKDELMSGVFLQVLNIPSIDEFERRIRLVENSNYDPDYAKQLLGDINVQFFFNLCLIYLQTIIRQLLRVQK